MDIFSGEAFYEKVLTFVDTPPVSEYFAFMGVGDSNFIMNSGSYFVIVGALFAYYLARTLANRLARCCARNRFARMLGMAAYSPNYSSELAGSLYKLFLESYLDLVVCSLVNLHAFIRMRDQWPSFFATRDDALCSTLAILYTGLILFVPSIAFALIHRNQGNLERGND